MCDLSLHDKLLEVGEMGVLQHLKRIALNGMVAEVTGELKRRMLYSLSNPADSEICPAYKIRVAGHPSRYEKIEWCVKPHQIRRIAAPGDAEADLLNLNARRKVSGMRASIYNAPEAAVDALVEFMAAFEKKHG